MPEGPRVAVVEADPASRQATGDLLRQSGFAVVEATNGAELRSALANSGVDLIVLETALPGEDGLALARFVREEHSRVAVLLVSAEAAALDRIVGLELGADDYMAKPYDPRELVARIKSVLRRTGRHPSGGASSDAPHRVAFGRCVLDLASKRLHGHDGETIALSKLEFALLKTFAENPRRVLTRDQLLDLAHGGSNEPYDRSIDIRIGRIRKKIEYDPADPRTIRTVRGAGYMYVPGD